MSKKTAVVDVVARNILTKAGKTAKPIPVASSGMAPQMPLMLLDGLMQLKQAHADYQRLREEEKTVFVPANIDTSSMDIAPTGSDMGQIKQPDAPPAPSTDHISLQK